MESSYKMNKRIRELEAKLLTAENNLYSYRAVAKKMHDWLSDFAKSATTGSPNPTYGLNLMKELFK